LPRALDIAGDVLQNPTFPAEELERERKIALGRLMMVRDEPRALAKLAVLGTLYGQDHPYGKPTYGTPASLQSISRSDLREFYRARMRPEEAAVIVVGDVTPDEIVGRLENALGGWKADAEVEETDFPPVPSPRSRRVILVDKPGAAQSVITVGLPGAERSSPDYFNLVVMNAVFGGQFSSRLNMNLREDKGYTYGARSTFSWRVRQPGPFTALASVETGVTAPALTEFIRELQGIVGRDPVRADELQFCKSYRVRGYPADFETPRDVARQLENVVEYGLPDDYFNRVIPSVQAVTAEDVQRVAEVYLKLDQLTVIVVGDRRQIEAGLRDLPCGRDLEVMRFDEQFRLVPAD
jgi:predicted Zn-dependent peptidase